MKDELISLLHSGHLPSKNLYTNKKYEKIINSRVDLKRPVGNQNFLTEFANIFLKILKKNIRFGTSWVDVRCCEERKLSGLS
jgi:hypothetical protein